MNPKSERNSLVVQLHIDGQTMAEIGRRFGITRERVRQIVTAELGQSFTRDRWRVQREIREGEIASERNRRTSYRNSLEWIRDRSAVAENGCWIWQKALYPTGYGSTSKRGGGYAHRVSWEIANGGPIPDGLTIDHLCRVRACVNPDHLEAVTLRENLLRSPIAVAALNARKTHCVHGHEFTEKNTIRSGNHRKCRSCHNAYQRKVWANRKGRPQ